MNRAPGRVPIAGATVQGLRLTAENLAGRRYKPAPCWSNATMTPRRGRAGETRKFIRVSDVTPGPENLKIITLVRDETACSLSSPGQAQRLFRDAIAEQAGDKTGQPDREDHLGGLP